MTGYLFKVNGIELMSNWEKKAWTVESFGQALDKQIGAGKCIQKIYAPGLSCDPHACNQMLGVLMPRVSSDTGLQQLYLEGMKGGVTGGDVMPKLVDTPINSLNTLSLTSNADWWKSGDAFAQLLVFLGRQTHLEEF